MNDHAELRRFAEEHLTAAALMLKLDKPLKPTMPAFEARRYLKKASFDLALVEDERLAVVTLDALRDLKQTELSWHVAKFAETPKRDRLIDHTTPIRRVAAKLSNDHTPLLVAGEGGLTHIVTLSDFGGVAGTAVVLAFTLAVDEAFNDLLRLHEERAWNSLSADEQRDAESRRKRAQRKRAALERLDYLSMGSRLNALRNLDLDRKYDLGTMDEHDLLLDVRNASAHGTAADPERAIRAIDVAESVLAKFKAVLTT